MLRGGLFAEVVVPFVGNVLVVFYFVLLLVVRYFALGTVKCALLKWPLLLV